MPSGGRKKKELGFSVLFAPVKKVKKNLKDCYLILLYCQVPILYFFAMTIHNLYMFDRQGILLYYGEWNRRRPAGMTIEEVCTEQPIFYTLQSPLLNKVYFYFQEGKLMYGMLFTIQKRIVPNMSPTDVKEGFLCYKTSKYKLNYFETPSGIKYVMNTDLNSLGVRELLQAINSQVLYWFVSNQANDLIYFQCVFQVYVEYCVKNPAYNPGEVIQSELFKTKLEELLKQSPIFKS